MGRSGGIDRNLGNTRMRLGGLPLGSSNRLRQARCLVSVAQGVGFASSALGLSFGFGSL